MSDDRKAAFIRAAVCGEEEAARAWDAMSCDQRDAWADAMEAVEVGEGATVLGIHDGQRDAEDVWACKPAKRKRRIHPPIEEDAESPWKIIHKGEREQTAVMAVPGGWLIRLRTSRGEVIEVLCGNGSAAPEGWPPAL